MSYSRHGVGSLSNIKFPSVKIGNPTRSCGKNRITPRPEGNVNKFFRSRAPRVAAPCLCRRKTCYKIFFFLNKTLTFISRIPLGSRDFHVLTPPNPCKLFPDF